jgi:hypothetical protein
MSGSLVSRINGRRFVVPELEVGSGNPLGQATMQEPTWLPWLANGQALRSDPQPVTKAMTSRFLLRGLYGRYGPGSFKKHWCLARDSFNGSLPLVFLKLLGHYLALVLWFGPGTIYPGAELNTTRRQENHQDSPKKGQVVQKLRYLQQCTPASATFWNSLVALFARR